MAHGSESQETRHKFPIVPSQSCRQLSVLPVMMYDNMHEVFGVLPTRETHSNFGVQGFTGSQSLRYS